MKRLLLTMLVAVSAHAQIVATNGRDVVVAHDGRIELFDARMNRVWSVDGVENPAQIAIGSDRIAVIDSFANRIRIADIGSGRGQTMSTGETPVQAIFAGRDLFVLDRDASELERIGGGLVNVDADASFLRAAAGRLFVYSRLDGLVQEIDPQAMRVVRTLATAPFASDFETDGRTGYLLYPPEAKLRTFSLEAMKRTGDIGVGVVPVDLTVASHGNALSASRLAVADPSAKRVWMVEGAESISAAVTRGFLRGLLGLGLFRPASSQFPTGVDRVMTGGSITLAYDSTTRTLYRVNGSKSSVVARDVGPGGFAIAGNAITVWQNGSLRLIR